MYLRCALAACAVLVAAAVMAAEREVASIPVGRQTDDRWSDLLDALNAEGKYDEALSLCASQSRGQPVASDAAARWAIAESQVRARRQMGRESFVSEDVERIEKPILDLIRAYPDHQRRLFLEAQRIAVAKNAAMHRVLRAAVSPASDSERMQATTMLLRGTNRANALLDQIAAERSRRSRLRDDVIGADYLRLEQELRVDVVSMALIQTELFPIGSTDSIAAATRAEQLADEAMERLPTQTPARHEVERLRVEAILRSGQIDRALTEAARLARSPDKPLPALTRALIVRLHIQSGNQSSAQALLDEFFGEVPESAAPSIEMDLARLEYLLTYQSTAVADWFESIGRRGGPYARRRAEAIALSRVGSPDNPSVINTTLIAVEARDWLRRGEAGRAGELLSAAAAAENDHDRALAYATEAAAAFVSANRPLAAATVLRETAINHPTANSAATAHLQAIVLAQSMGGDEASASAIEAALRRHLERWPGGSIARDVRRWLQQLLTAQGRHIDAAEVASNLPVDELSEQDAESIIQTWRTAFRSQPIDAPNDLSLRLADVLARTAANPLMKSRHRLIGALLLDPEFLNLIPDSAADDAAGPWANALIEFRRRGATSELLQDPPPQYLEDVVKRLMHDGRANQPMREPIVQLIGRWRLGNEPSFDAAERLLWKGDVNAASEMLRQLIAESSDRADTARRAAGLLSGFSAGGDKAIRIWDSLAAGSRQGSPLWHKAKLASINLLVRAGRTAEANRRAKYVLLTNPQMNDELKRKYESAVR